MATVDSSKLFNASGVFVGFALSKDRSGMTVRRVISDRTDTERLTEANVVLSPVNMGNRVPVFALFLRRVLSGSGWSFRIAQTMLDPLDNRRLEIAPTPGRPGFVRWATPVVGPRRRGEVLRLTNDSSQTVVYVWDEAGEPVSSDAFIAKVGVLLDFTPSIDGINDAGESIGSYPKMGKRGNEITRISPIAAHGEWRDLDIRIMDDLDPVSACDGISAVRRSAAIRWAKFYQDYHGQSWKTQKLITDIANGTITDASFRLWGPLGLIKGNALILPDKLLPADVVTFRCNIKPEFATDGWYQVTLEPAAGIGPVMTNDGILSTWFDVPGMMSPEMLTSGMRRLLSDALEHTDEWLDAFIDNPEDSFSGAIRAADSIFGELDRMSSAMARAGIDPYVSQLVRYMHHQRYSSMLLSKRKLSEGYNWLDKSRNRMPVLWAFRAYVMTSGALRAFGVLEDDECGKTGFVDSLTHTFVVPDDWFEVNRTNLGGADLDDQVMVLIREVDSRLSGIILRDPTDWGEYGMIDIAEDVCEHALYDVGHVPQVRSSMMPKQLTAMVADGNITIGQLPAQVVNSVHDDLSDAERMVGMVYGAECGTGSVANVKWAYYATHRAPIANHPCSNEDMIDLFQQGQGDLTSARVIKSWVGRVKDALLDGPDGSIDAYWAVHRLGVDVNDIASTSVVMSPESSPMVKLMRTREKMVREVLAELLAKANNRPPRIPTKIAEIGESLTPDELKAIRVRITGLDSKRKQFATWNRRANLPFSDADRVSYPQWLSDRMEDLIARDGWDKAAETFVKQFAATFVLKAAYPGRNWDQHLFSVDPSADVQPWGYLLEAIVDYPRS